MSLFRLAPTDTRTDPTTNDRWRRLAARAAHPSTRRPHGNALATIVAGLASVTAPWELRTGETPAESP